MKPTDRSWQDNIGEASTPPSFHPKPGTTPTVPTTDVRSDRRAVVMIGAVRQYLRVIYPSYPDSCGRQGHLRPSHVYVGARVYNHVRRDRRLAA